MSIQKEYASQVITKRGFGDFRWDKQYYCLIMKQKAGWLVGISQLAVPHMYIQARVSTAPRVYTLVFSTVISFTYILSEKLGRYTFPK